MRAPGLALVLLGSVSFVLPSYRQYAYLPLSDLELHVTAAVLLIAGAVFLLLGRNA